jgi:hypothetical protein
MRRLVLLVAIVALVAVAIRYALDADEGAVDRASQRTAKFVREQGPGASERTASGIETTGRAVEAGARTIRRVAQRSPKDDGVDVTADGQGENQD